MHFASDPGPDFTWWSDDEDTKIATNATLTNQQKLDLLSKYVDLVKVSLKKPKYATLNGQLTDLANTVANGVGKASSWSASSETAYAYGGSQGDIVDERSRLHHRRPNVPPSSTTASPQRWRGSTGNLSTNGQKAASYLGVTRATWTKLTKSLKKRLKSKTRSSATSSSKKTDSSSIVDGNGRNNNYYVNNFHSMSKSSCPVNLNEIRDSNLIVGAKLHSDAHHQFMDEMINNYLKAARQRFDNDKDQKNVQGGVGGGGRLPRRERLSRSFSASSVLVKCMNGNCDGQGSHQTNFLCDLCFKTQKQLMESFTTSNNNNNYHQPTSTLPGRASSVPSHAVVSTLPFRRGAEPTSFNVARSAFYNGDASTTTPAPTMVNGHSVARSTFYAVGPNGVDIDDDGQSASPSVTVVHPIVQQMNGVGCGNVDSPNGMRKLYRSIETRYGVNSVTTPTGVTHYYMPDEEDSTKILVYCNNARCSRYRSSCSTLCAECATAAAKNVDV